MKVAASNVQEYLAALPPERAEVLEAIRKVFLANVDSNIEEGLQYGMIGYDVPHRIFPDGYHCDPKQPLPYAGLAAQKNHYAIYMMSLYAAGVGDDPDSWFHKAWAATGRKLDMGKGCIRFKKLEDAALDVIAEAIRRSPSTVFIEHYVKSRPTPKKKAPAKR